MLGKKSPLTAVLSLLLLATGVFAEAGAEAAEISSSEGQQLVIAIILGFSTGALITIYLLRRLKK